MNKNRFLIRIFISGFIGYFIGSIIYNLFNTGNGGLDKAILALSVMVVAVIGILNYYYLKVKYPKVIEDIESEASDERGQFIRGRTAIYTITFIACLAGGLFIYSILLGNQILSYIIAGAIILTWIFNIAIKGYLDQRN